MDTELAFLIPALVDQNFKKAQIFFTSRLLSDLVGNARQLRRNNSQLYTSFIASWITRELKKLNSSVQVYKLNGENSHREKERVTHLFKEG